MGLFLKGDGMRSRDEKVRAMRAKGMKLTDIAKRVGVHHVTVWKILQRTARVPKRAPVRHGATETPNGYGKTYEALNFKREALLAQANRILDAMNAIKEL